MGGVSPVLRSPPMPPILPSDVLTPHQLAFIAERLPEPPCAPRGKRPYSNPELLPGILRGILPDLAKTTEPTLLADKGYDSLRFRQFVHDHGFQPLIPTRRCIPAEQATGELYARTACSSGSATSSSARSAGSKASGGCVAEWTGQTPRFTPSSTWRCWSSVSDT